jgi:hypothetical protein
MILEQLTLDNFCLYGGRQVFDLTPGRRGGKPLSIVHQDQSWGQCTTDRLILQAVIESEATRGAIDDG